MLRVTLLALLTAPAFALKLPVSGVVTSAERLVPARRSVLGGAAALLASQFACATVTAYDSIPVETPDFQEAERKRKEREEMVKKETEKLMPYVKRIEATTTADEFEQAADDFALFIIGAGKISEGVKVKELAGRIRSTYESLPQKKYKCPKGQEKRDGALCTTPGVNAELAFTGLMKQMRKYSMIQLGDFRKVEFAQF